MQTTRAITYSERVPWPTNYVADISLYRAVEGIELARRRTHRDRVLPSPIPSRRSGAGNKHIASLITNGHAPAL